MLQPRPQLSVINVVSKNWQTARECCQKLESLFRDVINDQDKGVRFRGLVFDAKEFDVHDSASVRGVKMLNNIREVYQNTAREASVLVLHDPFCSFAEHKQTIVLSLFASSAEGIGITTDFEGYLIDDDIDDAKIVRQMIDDDLQFLCSDREARRQASSRVADGQALFNVDQIKTEIGAVVKVAQDYAQYRRLRTANAFDFLKQRIATRLNVPLPVLEKVQRPTDTDWCVLL